MGLPESATAGSSERGQATAGANMSAITMLGLAFSVGASSLLFPVQSAAAISVPSAGAQGITITHIVREGETLWSLAQRYSVSPEAIAQANDVDADSLRVGQAIDIVTLYEAGPSENVTALTSPVPSLAKTEAGQAAASRNLAQIQIEQAAPELSGQAESAVSSGLQDSKRKKAKLLASPRVGKALAEQNVALTPAQPTASGSNDVAQPFSDAAVSDLLDSADIAQASETELSHQFEEQATVQQATVQQGTEYSVAASSVWTPQLGSGAHAATTTHTIRIGETISSIARAHRISIGELVALNGLRNPNRVFVGQVLTVPANPVLSETVPDIATPVVQEPVRLAAALPVALPTAEATDLPEAVRNSAQPQRPQVQNPQAQSLQAQNLQARSIVENEAPEAQAAAVGLNAYAEDLQDDIEVMAEVSAADSPVGDAAPSEPGADAPAETTVALSSRSTETVDASVGEDDAVNPEFAAVSSATANEAASQSGVERASNPAQPSQSDDGLVASAPLGSENYRPLAEPVTGRMVSPELPPLSDPEHHLPGTTMPMDGYLWPARGLLTSGYGWRWGRMHRGIDVAAPVGTPIVAAAPGVVEFSGWNSGGYGNMVDIRHPDGNKTRYAHNSRNLVRVGQKVNQGDQIAAMGSTGYSTGPHVHFEIHVPSQGAVNPTAMLPAR